MSLEVRDDIGRGRWGSDVQLSVTNYKMQTELWRFQSVMLISNIDRFGRCGLAADVAVLPQVTGYQDTDHES